MMENPPPAAGTGWSALDEVLCGIRPGDNIVWAVDRIGNYRKLVIPYEAAYIFDCISHLGDAWHSDQALANFFVLTCPRLYDLQTVTYFAFERERHSIHALGPIRLTTQFYHGVFDGCTLLVFPANQAIRSTSHGCLPRQAPRPCSHQLPDSCTTWYGGSLWTGLSSIPIRSIRLR